MVQIHDSDPEFLVGGWHNVLITVWRRTATVERLRKVAPCQRDFMRRYPGGFTLLSIVEPEGRDFSAESRAEAAKLGRETHAYIRGQAYVIEGRGFMAAAVRSIVSGTMLLTRFQAPQKVFDGVGEAGPWLVKLAQPHSAEPLAHAKLLADSAVARRTAFGAPAAPAR